MGNFFGKLFGYSTYEVKEEPLPKETNININASISREETPIEEVCKVIEIQETAIVEEENENRSVDKRTQLTKDIIETAVRNEYGQDAILVNFEIKDFTKPGDNYATLVTSVQCDILVDKCEMRTSYIVKLNNSWKLAGADAMTAEFYLRESKFLTVVKVQLNKILKSLGEADLCLPECVFHSLEKGKEILMTKDLRERNFKMFDRQVGMNVEHTTMVMNSAAKIHAAGFIYKEKNKGKSLLSIFPYLQDSWMTNPEAQDGFVQFFSGIMVNSAALLENREGYEMAREWILTQKENIIDTYMGLILSEENSFTTICHGDIWNNNVLFRYDEGRNPVEIFLVDLQMGRVSSLATDLQYFLSASMNGKERSKNLEFLLHSYYSTLEKILRKAEIDVPFSFAELKAEYESKYVFGLISIFILLPLVMKEEGEVMDFTKINEDNMSEMLNEDMKSNSELMKNNPIFESRFLSMFDEGLRLGVFDKTGH